MKEMLTGFSSYGKTSCLVSARVESALHGLTDRCVFVLNSLANRNALKIAFPRLSGSYIRKVEVEDHLSLIHTARNHQVRVQDTVVPVDHEVWIDPVIESPIPSTHGTGLHLSAFAYHRTPLQTEVLAVLDLIIGVIQHAV